MSPKRMALSSVTRGRIDRPLRVLVAGTPGVGKSTFAAGAPSPIFLCAEDGAAQLDVARFPAPMYWQDILDAVDSLLAEPHDFKTFVLDTADAAEPLAWAQVCMAAKKDNIEAFGYGKGYVEAAGLWRGLLARVQRLRDERGMHVVLTAHTHIKLYKSPNTEDYDRFELRLHKAVGALLSDWVDVHGFCAFETFAAKSERTSKAKGISTGNREMHTNRTATFDAKNRYAMPDVLPLDWAEMFAATRSVERLRAAIEKAAAGLPDDEREKVPGALAWCGEAPDKLSQLLAKIQDKLTPKEPEES